SPERRAERRQRTASCVVYVFVAATDRSRPEWQSTVSSAVAASAELCALVTASVKAPWARAARTTATISVDSPDWEMPTTSALRSRGVVSYRVVSAGAASATGRLLPMPHRYLA